MKKYIFTFMCIIISMSIHDITFWWCSECKIKDWPPEVLTNYISNLKKVRTNISKTLLEQENEKAKLKKDYDATKSKVNSFFNGIIDWDSYYSLFDFYVMYSAKNEYVMEVWRDYNLLENESKWMEKYLKYVTSKWLDNFKISKEKVCAEVENCNIEWNILDVIGELIKNHEAIKEYYRLSIVGKKDMFNKKMQLVEVNFTTHFWEYYNENTTKNCSLCEWASFDKIKQEITKITNRQQNAKDGIKSWQDAIAMLDGTKDKREYERLERDLLKRQLARDGTSTQSSQNALKNLERYNQWWWYSLNNNFITNSFDHLKNSVTSQIVWFRDSIVQQFRNAGKKSVPSQHFSTNRDDLKITKWVEETIKELYNRELPYAQLIDTSTDNLQWKIIELHYNMAQSINSMNKTKKVSEKVCNSQAQWLWNCSTK